VVVGALVLVVVEGGTVPVVVDVELGSGGGGVDDGGVVVSGGTDEVGAGVVVGVGAAPPPAGVDAGAGRTSRYSTSVPTNATTSTAVERRTLSRISGVPRRVCSPHRAS
jgi:hypothetical protein